MNIKTDLILPVRLFEFYTIIILCLSDGPNSSSSTSTSSSGSLPLGVGPNIVMGAFSMPVDVVGATQVTKQSFLWMILINH